MGMGRRPGVRGRLRGAANQNLLLLALAAICFVFGGTQAPAESKAATVTKVVVYYGDSIGAESAVYLKAALASRGPVSPVDRIWLDSPPPTRYESITHRKSLMVKLMADVAATRTNTSMIDAGAVLEDGKGDYTRLLACMDGEPCNGPPAGSNRVRARDGLHLCPAILRATISTLRRCPVWSSGGWRYGNAQAAPVAAALWPARAAGGP